MNYIYILSSELIIIVKTSCCVALNVYNAHYMRMFYCVCIQWSALQTLFIMSYVVQQHACVAIAKCSLIELVNLWSKCAIGRYTAMIEYTKLLWHENHRALVEHIKCARMCVLPTFAKHLYVHAFQKLISPLSSF